MHNSKQNRVLAASKTNQRRQLLSPVNYTTGTRRDSYLCYAVVHKRNPCKNRRQQSRSDLLSRAMEGPRYTIASSLHGVPLRTIRLSDSSSTGSPGTDEYRAHLTSNTTKTNKHKGDTTYMITDTNASKSFEWFCHHMSDHPLKRTWHDQHAT